MEIFLFFLVFWVAAMIVSCVQGPRRGYPNAGCLLGFFFGWLGVIVLLLLPNKAREREEREIAKGIERQNDLLRQQLAALQRLSPEPPPALPPPALPPPPLSGDAIPLDRVKAPTGLDPTHRAMAWTIATILLLVIVIASAVNRGNPSASGTPAVVPARLDAPKVVTAPPNVVTAPIQFTVYRNYDSGGLARRLLLIDPKAATDENLTAFSAFLREDLRRFPTATVQVYISEEAARLRDDVVGKRNLKASEQKTLDKGSVCIYRKNEGRMDETELRVPGKKPRTVTY